MTSGATDAMTSKETESTPRQGDSSQGSLYLSTEKSREDSSYEVPKNGGRYQATAHQADGRAFQSSDVAHHKKPKGINQPVYSWAKDKYTDRHEYVYGPNDGESTVSSESIPGPRVYETWQEATELRPRKRRVNREQV